MKRLILILVFTTLSIILRAQSIYADQIIPNGLRQISCTGTEIEIAGGKYTFFLTAATGDGGSIWGMLVGSELFIAEDAELLMKFDNDEVIHLHADQVNVSALTTPEHYITYHNGGISETYVEPSRDRDYYVSIFKLSEDQVSLLENHTVKKIRISLGRTYLEETSGLKKLSRGLSKSVKLIRERMSRPMVSSSSITEGF